MAMQKSEQSKSVDLNKSLSSISSSESKEGKDDFRGGKKKEKLFKQIRGKCLKSYEDFITQILYDYYRDALTDNSFKRLHHTSDLTEKTEKKYIRKCLEMTMKQLYIQTEHKELNLKSKPNLYKTSSTFFSFIENNKLLEYFVNLQGRDLFSFRYQELLEEYINCDNECVEENSRKFSCKMKNGNILYLRLLEGDLSIGKFNESDKKNILILAGKMIEYYNNDNYHSFLKEEIDLEEDIDSKMTDGDKDKKIFAVNKCSKSNSSDDK